MSYWPVHKFMNLRKVLTPKQTAKLSDLLYIVIDKTIEPIEASQPNMVTSYPGPKAIEKINRLSQHMAGISRNSDVIDYDKSFGNYFTDIDGNVVLDMHMDNGRNVLGYNSRKFLRESKLQKYSKFMIQRPGMGVLPPEEYPKLVSKLMMKIAPPNLNEITFSAGDRTSANENAIKLAFLHKFYELKGTTSHTDEDNVSVFKGVSPGAPDFSFITFEGSNHGSSLNFTEHGWPQAPFPKIKYPYEENEAENRKEEQRCVSETEKIIKNSNKPVAGLMIEPLQPGVRYASSQFYKDLIDLCYHYNVPFICDETNTSGWADGRPFMHKRWIAEKPVHMVTFGGRMQSSGVIYQSQFRPAHPFQIHSTWSGDPAKLIQVQHIVETVEKVWLDNHGATFLQGIKSELYDVQRRWDVRISNIRGIGKIFAFDVEDRNIRDEIVYASRCNGFKVGVYSDRSIVFTPSILFTEIHFAKFKNFLLNFHPSSANVYQLRL
jgi:4-aminobutyrate aminotransferase/(S)-3-amino-2-methylpropionate transaminase